MTSPTTMEQSVIIRPVTRGDVDQVIQLARAVQIEMAMDILSDQLFFLIHHPWPYMMATICIIICWLLSEGGLLQSLALGVLLAGLEEALRFAFFVSRWLDIFFMGDDILDAFNTFSGEGREFLVAKCGGQVVGTVGLKGQEGCSRSSVGHVTRFFVLAKWRGKGLGSRLMEASNASLRRMGYTSSELLTHHTNTNALHFYKKHGFRLFNVIHYASVYPYAYDQHELVLTL